LYSSPDRSNPISPYAFPFLWGTAQLYIDRFFLAMIFIIMTLIGWRDDKREAEIKSEESIRGIARSFDRRVIDPWIAGAVYEEIVDLYPVRSRDAFQEGFKVGEEDLEESLKAIA
jgi:hypothetical protein